MCTVDEFTEALEFSDVNLIDEDITALVDDDKLTGGVTFYSTDNYRSMLHNLLGSDKEQYMFSQVNFVKRIATLLSQNKGKINPNWVLLDSQSTINMFCNPLLLKFVKRDRPIG